ncbi:MAG: 50S ribosomal protein L6 [Alcanivorax sp.]|jgi:large subunit ribosomal protein L6|uniref:Large ribosomal subunit protein uL6 n=1 Tax=Alloalcanivorax venustensis ISO4 TaxID=1177184 RepID=A0ABS0AIW9_9GAMM|nr:50S ribosomal protein L6 [Alloalcanivorax venustensis]MAD70011.1 50S ribosomal protein L6 [Alcanivorax sp.]MCH9783389.1 50S ribosomal protein L6 [Gammaproteobacteria bacterium]MEA3260523.1 50S ribosomal protein L6 [Pseudomonadota bacterium]SMO83881.1 LSU ribosomal protein L6P [Alcanivorax sp. DSM 26295]MAK23545.1 50S ribosomal protein L6 [Alcanivorax sp.]|tara:strand:- start:26410 stop:26943 length:534 start_codon:yes stop_codon:yes gene_type:complete
MSRVAKNPVKLPSGVELKIDGRKVSVKGSKGNLEHEVHEQVDVSFEDGIFTVKPREESQESWALAGTTRAVVNNMVTGVSEGFERKLVLNGVGYRAQAQGKTLNLTLGFSHPVAYQLPDGITIETPTQTEIVVKGIDKQLVGQVAANVRAFRPPEPYKGKGVRYADEQVRRKEAKKK